MSKWKGISYCLDISETNYGKFQKNIELTFFAKIINLLAKFNNHNLRNRKKSLLFFSHDTYIRVVLDDLITCQSHVLLFFDNYAVVNGQRSTFKLRQLTIEMSAELTFHDRLLILLERRVNEFEI